MCGSIRSEKRKRNEKRKDPALCASDPSTERNIHAKRERDRERQREAEEETERPSPRERVRDGSTLERNVSGVVVLSCVAVPAAIAVATTVATTVARVSIVQANGGIPLQQNDPSLRHKHDRYITLENRTRH